MSEALMEDTGKVKMNYRFYQGTDIYSDAKESSSKVTETNFFKDDRNYYKILKRKWRMLKREIHEIFAEI